MGPPSCVPERWAALAAGATMAGCARKTAIIGVLLQPLPHFGWRIPDGPRNGQRRLGMGQQPAALAGRYAVQPVSCG